MTDGITIIGNTNIDVMVADIRDLPEPGTERVVSSVSLRLGGSAGNLAVRCAGLGFPGGNSELRRKQSADGHH